MKFHISQVYKALATCSACPVGATHRDGKLICNHDNNEIEFLCKSYNCPLNKWTSKLTEDQSKLIHTPVKKPPRNRGVWNAIKGLWHQADEAISKTASFSDAVFSGFANESEIKAREVSCYGNETQKPCENLVVGQDGYKYCGACGCGEWALARLNGTPLPKLKWKNLPCPLARPGFSNHEENTNAH